MGSQARRSTVSTVRFCAFAAFLSGVICSGPYALAQRPKKTFQVTWLGHAAFEVISPGGTAIIIDPWLNQDPQTPAAFKDLTRYHPAAILVTHSHFDHSQDAVELAKDSGAPVVASSDWLETRALPKKQHSVAT
jgi:glyoxylase-like metal-dependent hydrolase (beta-lactamase superfamily II)